MGSLVENIDIRNIFSAISARSLPVAILILVIGFPAVNIIALLVKRTIAKNASEQSKLIIKKTIVYTGFAIVIFMSLSEMGIRLSALLGAAGVIGVAIGIASQTSFSNIISGLFLVSEKAFEIGDVVRIGDKTGVVYSIDLLSMKLKTFDNLLIRIPNQQIISNELTNITKFQIRRMDFNLGVSLKSDLEKVERVLREIAAENPLCLTEPEPLVLFKDYSEYRIEILLGVWFQKSNFLKVKNEIIKTIQKRFAEENIEIPFPSRFVIMNTPPARQGKGTGANNGEKSGKK